MKKSRFTEEQGVYTLRQAQRGMLIADVCSQLGVSEVSICAWK
jgi:putative transposase